MSFDPIAICRILNEEGVEYVVIGGLATVLMGSPLPTEDIDVVPNRSDANLERLANALTRLNAKIRTAGEPVTAKLDAAFLANMPPMLNLITDFGIVDLTFQPSGPLEGFRGWNVRASSEEISEGLRIRVASLDDVIDSKEAAGREKDLRSLPYLKSLRDSRASDS
ncbi:MAG: hypothetical protein KGP12_03000 [Actinomycetales bacterium]|nr:hypothetical protein [Actinomycetales bacterium]